MMTDQLPSSSIIYLGGALAIVALWVLTSLAVNWDTRQRNLSVTKRKFWVTITILLPLFGFALYLAFRVFKGYLIASPQKMSDEDAARRTAVKPDPVNFSVRHQAFAGKRQESFLQPAWENESPVRPNGKHPVSLSEHSIATISAARQASPIGFVIAIVSGPNMGQKFILQHFPAIIGRGAEASVPLDGDLNVSRKHAQIIAGEGFLQIRDLNSMHGTLVNGIAIKEKILKPGDQIRIGSTTLLLDEIGQSWDGSFGR